MRRSISAIGIAAVVTAASVLPTPARAACGSKGVYVFDAYWCPHCKQVEALLNRYRIAYRTIETTGNSQALAFMARQFNTMAVPVTVIDDSYVLGFNEPQLKQLLCIQ